MNSLVAGIQFHARLHSPGFPSLFSNHHIKLLLKGFQRSSPTAPDKRLPITLTILHNLIAELRKGSFSPYLDSLLEAVLLLAFYGFLRVGEFTTKSVSFNPDRDVCFSDLSFFSDGFKLSLKHSKSDRGLKGCVISVAKITGDFCPFSAMLRYLSVRSRTSSSSPLFILPNGLPLYQRAFTTHLNTLIKKCGLPPDRYSSHSLRIGAATTAAQKGIPPLMLKSMGRWSSSAFSTYVRPNESSVLGAQMTMASVRVLNSLTVSGGGVPSCIL